MFFVLYLCDFQCFLYPEVLLGPIFGASGLTRGPMGLTFEGLGLTLEAHGITLGAFELQFSSPWGHLGIILVAIGSIWGPLGCSKSSKMHQEC